MALTKAETDRYVKDGGVNCPYCQSDQIEGDGVEVDAGRAWQEMFCPNCEKSWTDRYTLTSIEYVEGQE